MPTTLSFDAYRSEWLRDIEEGSPSTVELGRRFAHKLVSDWLELDEAAIALSVLNVVRVVALGAGEPALLAGAGKFADLLAVNVVAPVAQLVAVAFPA